MDWKYYIPYFECDSVNVDLLRFSPWSGHRYFIYDLIANEAPNIVVELGSYYGCSSFAIAQAIKDHNLDTIFWGIDTWQGDDFTETDYTQNVYQDFCNVREKCYSENYIKMLRMTFDEAVARFEDETIDLLHIDGSHHYEDVKHDFLTWKSKVKKDGIILFHDIADDKIYDEILGSHQFWMDLKEEYPFTLQFDFSMGLGILFLDEEQYQHYKKNYQPQHYQRLNNSQAVELKDELRKKHFQLSDAQYYIEKLKEQVEIKEEHLQRYAKDDGIRQQYIAQLEKSIESIKTNYEVTIDGKDRYIKELEENQKSFKKAHINALDEKNKYITELEANLNSIKADYELTISQKEQDIKQLTDSIANVQNDYQKTIDGKNNYITELESAIDSVKNNYELTMVQKDQYIKQLMDNIASVQNDYQKTIDGKDKYIAELEDKSSAAASEHKTAVAEKESLIKAMESEQKRMIGQYEDELAEITQELKECREKNQQLALSFDRLNTQYQKTLAYKISHLIMKKE